MGFPGKLDAVVGNALTIAYTATTDVPTVLNLTNHTYFNVAGSGTILDHVVAISAECFTPVNDALIPLGEVRTVADTPFDFRQPMAIGARINADDEQLRIARGYDHNYVLGDGPSDAPRLAARVVAAGLDVAACAERSKRRRVADRASDGLARASGGEIGKGSLKTDRRLITTIGILAALARWPPVVPVLACADLGVSRLS